MQYKIYLTIDLPDENDFDKDENIIVELLDNLDYTLHEKYNGKVTDSEVK